MPYTKDFGTVSRQWRTAQVPGAACSHRRPFALCDRLRACERHGHHRSGAGRPSKHHSKARSAMMDALDHIAVSWLCRSVRDASRPSRRRWAAADGQRRPDLRHRGAGVVVDGLCHRFTREGPAPARTARRPRDQRCEMELSTAASHGVAIALVERHGTAPSPARLSTRHRPSPSSTTLSFARPIPSVPSPSMPAGWASICGSTAAIPTGARACCSSAAAISSSRSRTI